MKKAISLVLAFALLASLAACGKKGADVQMIFPISAEPEYLDPQIASGSDSACIIAACFEGLMTYDETGALVPAAAESYEVSFGELVYTFHLRDDLRWRVTNTAAAVLGEEKDSFDKRVTAEDFAFGLRRALWPQTKSPAAPYLMAIKNAPAVYAGEKKDTKLGVKVLDELTLEIKLSRKDDGFLAALTLPGAMPCDETYFMATHGRYALSPETFICNGPFYLSNWNSGVSLTVRKTRKNMDPYRDPNDVMPASIYFSVNADRDARLAKLRDGTYDATPLTSAQAASLAQEKSVTVQSFDSAVFALVFNCADPVLKSSAVRRAIAMALNSEPLLQATGLTAAEGLVPAACLWGKESYRAQTPAVAGPQGSAKKAKALLQNGMDELNVKDVDVRVLCAAALETAVRTVMQQWQSAFGVHFSVVVEPVEDAELQSRIRAGDYQMAFTTLTSTNTSALDTLLRYRSDSGSNPVQLKSRGYNALMQSIGTTIYPQKQLRALQKAERYLVQQAIVVPVGSVQTHIGFAKGVSGIGTNPTGDVLYFKHAIKV